MHIFCALSALLVRPLLAIPTTILSPSDLRRDISISLLEATDTSSNVLTDFNSLPSPTSLIFDLFGSHLPSSAVNAAFRGAITRIQPLLHSRPEDPITNDDFQYRTAGGSVQIGITAVLRHKISWQQLDTVLRQTSSFMNGDPTPSQQHMQELAFQIINDGVLIGEGLISYHPPRRIRSRDPTTENLKGTELLVLPTDPSLNGSTLNAIPFRIPGTPYKLFFGFLGDPIPAERVWAAFEGAHSKIIMPLGERPASPIPGERFDYIEQDVRITVLVNIGRVMTWKQLSWVLGGMYGFITTTPGHYQLLTCEIANLGNAKLGFASMWYYPPAPPEPPSDQEDPL